MRVVGGVSVGTRERVVVLEVADTWLVVGVAPGQVQTLHTLPRQESAGGNGALVGVSPFPNWLSRFTNKQADGTP